MNKSMKYLVEFEKNKSDDDVVVRGFPNLKTK